ncbi:MAG: anthranilate synthase component I family protein [Fusobacteriota bacterium]
MERVLKKSRNSIIDFYEINKEILNGNIIILDSANDNYGRYSYIMADFSDTIKIKDNKFYLNNEFLEGDIFSLFKDVIKTKKEEYMIKKDKDYFTGGFAGIFSYDLNTTIENIPNNATDDLNLPQGVFGIPQLIIIKDKKTDNFFEINYNNKNYNWDLNLKNKKQKKNIKGDINPSDLNLFDSNMSKKEFEAMVDKAKEYVKNGDIFQVNLSQRFEAPLRKEKSFELYKVLRQINPSPFASYLIWDDFTLISQSPERLVRIKDQIVEERPIAGTRRNKKETESEMERELILNEKERAEHIMLVDLVRNDIGRVCKYGTVHVNELMTIEKYSHVMHIVSNVKGELDCKKDAVDLIKATFPGGTITGAPKVRSMEIIEELEPTKRGFYTGSVGYIGFDGNMDLNIIIRSFIQKKNKIYFQVGAGIVYDSVSSQEYKEIINKGRAMILAYKTLIKGD